MRRGVHEARMMMKSQEHGTSAVKFRLMNE